MKQISTYFLSFIFSLSAFSQSPCDSISFIHCQKNIIQLNDDEKIKINNLLQSGDIRIVHIGDSHLQAAFLSERIKQQLCQYFQTKDQIASPGFIFPFAIAQTNNPFYYKVEYTGQWSRTRNVDEVLNVPVGLSGITVSTKHPNSEIRIKIENQRFNLNSKYWFNKITLLHNADNSTAILANNKMGQQNEYGTSWISQNNLDSITFTITKTDTTKNFNFYGLILELNDSKAQYHTIGVNGSTAKSYLKCGLFEDHLKLLNPNLVIISLGTNEAYSKDFSKEDFIFDLTNLISKIHNSNPDALLIITIPNDHNKDGQTNKNIEVIRTSIYQLRNYFSFGIWDFYEIMGGSGSINEWYKKQLATDERLHFTRKGYEIQGDLFFNALIKVQLK